MHTVIAAAARAIASTFNWDAMSAIGTTLAVIVALVIWLVDMWRRRRERRAAARLLAVRLISDVEELSRVLLSNLRAMDGHDDQATEIQRIDHMHAYTEARAKNGFAAKAFVQEQMDDVDLSRFEQLVSQVEIMDHTLSDSLTELLRRCISLKNVAKSVPPVGPEAEISGGLEKYYLETVRAQECAKRAVFQLYKSSGLRQKDGHNQGNPAAG